MLELKNIDLQFGTRIIFKDLNYTLFPKQRVGVVGRNGSGKSTLFALILGELQSDKGEVILNKGTMLASIAQEIKALDKPALHYVIAGYSGIGEIYLQLLDAEKHEDYDRLVALHQQLDELRGYEIEARASEILYGLGFSNDEIKKPVSAFSGGWRVRLSLARCLLAPSDLLLLDEPTNHLDLDALLWLEQWIKKYPGSLLLISHDRDFLDSVTDYTLALSGQTAKLYQGGYSSYEQQRAMQYALQTATIKKQEKQRAHLQSFVERFRAKASKAKQAQSRLKMIAKLPEIAQMQFDSDFSFSFKPCDVCSAPMLNFNQVSVGYGNLKVLDKINLSINPGDRIGLLGLNGAGKSTFIKLIATDLKPFSGDVISSKHLKIGYFAQHQLEALRLDESALWHMQALSPKVKESDLRSYLGSFGFSGDTVKTPVETFSGGEKSRLALALIVWQKPNLLLMDEPTNHLDIYMREALTLALQSYEGALMVVSHDRHLLKSTVDEFWLVDNQRVHQFEGDLDDYQQWLQQKQKAMKQSTHTVTEVKEAPSIKPTKQLAQLEKQMETLQQQLIELDEQLADPAIYADPQQTQQLASKRKAIAQELSRLEETWLKACG